MSRKRYMYGIDGQISQIFANSGAEIQFTDSDGTQECALLKKGRFYHNGKVIPVDVQLSKYIRINMKVKFCCHPLDRPEQPDNQDINHTRDYKWYVSMCWINSQDLPNNRVTVSMGLSAVPCHVESIKPRHGVLTTIDNKDKEHRITFLASKFYLHGKRFSSSKMLTSALTQDDTIYCDAVPSIEDECKDNCSWFATCAYQGKRPQLAQSVDTSIDVRTNLVSQSSKMLDRNSTTGNDKNYDDSLNRYLQESKQTSVKSRLLKDINVHTSNARSLYTSGYGFILDVLTDEYAILLGCFKLNVFQTILFHRGNAFLFKVPLTRSKLSEIFVEGDRMRFIAVRAPADFVTDWIAVRVSVAESTHDIKVSWNA